MLENKLVKCKYCNNTAALIQYGTNFPICKDCYIKYVEKKIQKTISKYNLVSRDDRICIGVSGGKDSLTLLLNLYQLYKKKKIVNKIAVINVDEGIKGYQIKTIEHLRNFIKKFEIDVDLYQIKFKDVIGITMDEATEIIINKQLKLNACTVCGTFRRRLLAKKAKEINATKLAIGHNLDDIAQTLIQNIIRNDLQKIGKVPPYASIEYEQLKEKKTPHMDMIPRIKPLMKLTEKEIISYCKFKNIETLKCPCQNAVRFPILRRKIKEFLEKFDERNYEIKYNLLKVHFQLYDILKPLSKIKYSTFNKCISCGELTNPPRKICKFCELKNLLEKNRG
ncbi:MAG: ATP-binding protein [Promethearchaeota archaeon]